VKPNCCIALLIRVGILTLQLPAVPIRTKSIKLLFVSGQNSLLVRSSLVGKFVSVERSHVYIMANWTKESTKGEIDLPEDDPAVIKLLIQYLYEGEYDPRLPDWASDVVIAKPERPKTNPNGLPYRYDFPHTCGFDRQVHHVCPHHTCVQSMFGQPSGCGHSCNMFVCEACKEPPPPLPVLKGKSSQLLIHAKMYEIADKYQVLGLKGLVMEKFRRSSCRFWNDPYFVVAARHALSTTPDEDTGLRDIVVKTIAEHISTLIVKKDVDALLTEFNGLAYRLLKMKVDTDNLQKPTQINVNNTPSKSTKQTQVASFGSFGAFGSSRNAPSS
jgi:hypothetical protein